MTQTTQTRTISLAQWYAMACEGAAPSVTIVLDGDSMRPFIRRGKDPVTIVPLKRELMIGDVVLFELAGRYVVHRVWKLQGSRVRTLGDNCWNPEPWFPQEQVLGLAVRYQRDGRVIPLDSPFARWQGRVWMTLHSIRKCYLRLRSVAARCYRKVFPKKRKAVTGSGE